LIRGKIGDSLTFLKEQSAILDVMCNYYLLAGCSATLRVFTEKNPKKNPQKHQKKYPPKNSKKTFQKKNSKKKFEFLFKKKPKLIRMPKKFLKKIQKKIRQIFF
jgi:hypothetical protein